MNTYAFTHHDHHVLIDRSRQVIEIEVAEDQGGLFELRQCAGEPESRRERRVGRHQCD